MVQVLHEKPPPLTAGPASLPGSTTQPPPATQPGQDDRLTGVHSASEDARLAAVRRYDILDSAPDGAFDRIATLAARVLGTPMAAVSIVDADRVWFKARHGHGVVEVGRHPGLCSSAIQGSGPYVVGDAAVDPRSATNPLVTGGFGLRFYAAAPLVTSDGFRLGTLHVMDRSPRDMAVDDVATLEDLAAVVMDELELRLAARRSQGTKAIIERLGAALQTSALPPTLPYIPGVELASYYLPGGHDLDIGGDFYEVFEPSPGCWVVAIGDVCGTGVDAAILMSSVRARLRALSGAGRSPSSVLEEISESLIHEDHNGRFCTLCYLEVRPERGCTHIVMSTGGHPLPLVRRVGGEVETVGRTGALLGGWPGIKLRDTAVHLAAGEMLLLYTDGLVEQRGLDALTGDQALRRSLAKCDETDVGAVLRCIEQTMPSPPGGRDDDTAMLLLRARADS